MALTNTSRPSSPSLTNTDKALDYDTWASIITTWASETRTWAQTVTLLSNTSRPTTTLTNVSKPS